jgi:hypothetical protein
MKVITNQIKLNPIISYNVKKKIHIPKTKLKLQKSLYFNTIIFSSTNKVFAEEIKQEPIIHKQEFNIQNDVSNMFIIYTVIFPTLLAIKLNQSSIIDLLYILKWFWIIMSLNLTIILILENFHYFIKN